jgi:NitT/TauT family transport system substrate-binding protein
MRNQNQFWFLLLVVLTAEHFTAAKTHAAEKNLLKVRAGYVTPTTDNILLPIAQKQGFLAKQGIEVEIIALRGGVQVAQALLSDSLQFAQMDGSVVVRSDLSGGDLVMIAGYVNRISYFLIAKPEIKDVKALTSKKIATASIGGSVDMVLRLGLKASGVDPKSVIFLSAGAPQTRMAAISGGQMDATIVPPENLAAVEKVGLRVLKDLSELDFYIQHTGLVVRRNLIKENRKMVRGFLVAIVDAINFYRTHEPETLDILAKFTGISDRDALKHSYDFHKKLFPQPPYPSREGFNTLLAEIGDKPANMANVAADMFFDRTLLDELKQK